MTIQILFKTLAAWPGSYAGERARKLFRYLTLLGLAGALLSTSASGQSLMGTFTARGQSSGVPIALNLSVSGGQIGGVMGTGQPGANPPWVNPASMVTRVQGSARGSQWVVQAGAFTMTGVFNGTTYSGSYTVGSQGGVFSLSTNAPVYRAPVGAAPPPVPVAPVRASPVPMPARPPAIANAPVAAPVAVQRAGAPVAATAEYMKGSMYYTGPKGTVVTQLVFNLNFSGNNVSGAVGIGSVIGGATIVGPLSADIPLQGTRTGQTCSVTLTGNGGGMTFTGTCTATGFSGIFRVGGQSGNFSVTTAGQVPAQVAAVPVPAPVPVRMPVPVVQAGTTTCPASGTAPQLYQGTLYGQARESIAFSLTFSGGRISGSMGMAMLGTTAATSNPVTGTLNGQRCTFTAGGVMQGAVFDGACNGQTFNGTYNAQGVPMQFMTSLAPGAANAVSTACTATAPAQLAANPPVVPPAPVQAGQTVYCGQITGPQFGATIEPVRIAMAATSNTPSTLTIGNNLPGSGVFYGVPAIAPNFACGVSTGALAFQGTCTPTSIAAYTRSNAAPGYGEIQASTQRCTNPMAALPAPFPAPAPVAPNPPPPVQAVVTPTPPAPIPQPAPKPAQPTHPPGVLYCGTFGNTTTQINGMLQILIYPGAGFSGELSVGQAISNASVSTFGSGTFTAMMGLNGDVNGCSATDSGGLSFYGTCTATEISSTSYSILGLDGKPQIGSFDVTTQGCGG